MSNIPLMRALMEAVQPVLPEVWGEFQMDGHRVHVGWQVAKDALNKRRHDGLSLRDGIPVLADPNNQFTIDHDNPNRDERERYIGTGAANMVLVVAVEWVDTQAGEEDPSVRIASVRKAEADEIKGVFGLEEDVSADSFDPDNPPLTGKEVWGSGREQILKRIAAHKAKYAARQAQQAKSQPPADQDAAE
jgi:uncharacterized DUF497 family protein